MNSINKPTVAFNVEEMRATMLARVAIPHDLVNKAIRKIHSKLDAKETKFFTFRGEVIDKVEVEAHDIQLRAADQINSIAGLYARERDARPATPAIAIEVDPLTGIIRMVVGGGDAYQITNPGEAQANGQPVLASEDTQLPLFDAPMAQFEAVGVAEPPVQVVKVKPGRLPDHIRDILFGNG